MIASKHDALSSEGNRDGLVGMGVGFTTRPMRSSASQFSFEVQAGYVPSITAVSRLLLRFELDAQVLGSSEPQLDLSVRPELGARLGPLEVSAIAVAGVQGVLLDQGDTYDGDGRAYLGYGAHVSLKPGRLLLDALLLREHQTLDAVPIATRADVLLGWRLKEAFFVVARVRGLAQADVGKAWSSGDHAVAMILGLMSQY